jgi:hypothetical protein
MAKVLRFVAFWVLPPHRHPLRYALRRAGLETTRTN